jgi:hypothetical protein
MKSVRRGFAWQAATLFFVLTVFGLLTFSASAAKAADVTINFDDLPVGTLLTNQYASKGVTFGAFPPTASSSTPLLIQSGVFAHSGSQFAAMMVNDSAGSWIAFPGFVDHVSMYVSIYAPTFAGPQAVGLIAFDPNGAVIASTSVQAGPDSFSTQLSLSSPPGGGAKIAYVQVITRGIVDCCSVAAAIDDLTYGPVNTTPGPDFAIIPQLSSVAAPLNVPVQLSIQLNRYDGSSGTINFSSAAPAGVNATIAPSDLTGAGAANVTFSATAPIAQGATVPVTITATPTSPSAGPTAHSVTIQFFVQSTVNLVLQGIEVTQGITNTGALEPTVSGGNYLGMKLIPPSPPENSVNVPNNSNGTPVTNPLAAHNRTIARVYVNAQGAPAAGADGVIVVLHGFSNGSNELPGSPLVEADAKPNTVPDISPAPVVSEKERISSTNAFMFTLPDSWTQGTISLVANVMAPLPSLFGDPPKWVECTTPVCQSNSRFTLNTVSFTPLPYVVIAPLRLAQPGDPPLPSSLIPIYKRALLTEPGANQYVLLPYVGNVDPSPEIKADSSPIKNLNSDYWQAVADWSPNYTLTYDILVGVQGTQPGDSNGAIFYDNPTGPTLVSGWSSANFNRPLTSVAHELGHTLGRNHADDSPATGKIDGSGSTGCKPQSGEGGPWPPDGLGNLQGIGLDTSTSPYSVLASPPSGTTQYYDKMSYCANESTAWISPYGWLHSMQTLILFGQHTGRGSIAPTAGGGLLQGIEDDARQLDFLTVSGLVTRGGAWIAQMARIGKAPPPPAVIGPFMLVARDATGRSIATTPMSAMALTTDMGSIEVRGAVPTANVNSVEIVKDDAVVASRRRNAIPPTVQILAPVANMEVGHTDSTEIRWNAKGDTPLKITVSYSADNGLHWRRIYAGPNNGQVALPNQYFSASGSARLRIEANDGFDTATAISAPFKAIGSPPSVTIVSPSPGQNFHGEVMVHLDGQAFDDAFTPLGDESLSWLIDNTTIGHGMRVSTTALSPGDHSVTLVARDRQGRKGSASVIIRVAPVVLPFLDLRVPSTVGNNARALTFTAASAVPVTLTVRNQRYAISREPRIITLTIPQNQPIPLGLLVSAQGLTHQLAFVVLRSQEPVLHPPTHGAFPK